MMNKNQISHRMQIARDLLYDAYNASFMNDTTDTEYRKKVGGDLDRIINQLQKVKLLLKTGRKQQPLE